MINDDNFANLFRQTPEMVCILAGPEHRFEFVNQAHVFALGFDATGKTVREAQPESLEVHGILDDVYRTGVTADLREIPVTLGSSVRFFNLTYAARRAANGTIDGIMIMGSEVTQQVLARRAQENQRAWLESVLNKLPSPTLFVDPTNAKVTFENDAAKHLMGASIQGLDASQIQQRSVAVVRDGAPLAYEDLPSTRTARGERLRDYEFELHTSAGNHVVSASTDMIPEMFGHPATGLIVLQDVTSQKKTQYQLQRSEEQLTLALATSKVGFYDWNILEDSITFSTQMRKDWGMPEHGPRMTLQDAIALIHPDDRKRTQAAIEASMRERTPYHLEYRIVRPDGVVVWFDVRGEVHYGADGKPVRFFGTSVDISARVENEATIRELADSMPQVVWTARPDGVLDYTNRVWTEYSGSTEPAKWLDFVFPEDRDRATREWIESVTTGKRYEIEFRLLRKHDQSHRWHLVRANPSRNERGVIVRWFGTCTDIEDQKRSEAVLREANLAAQAASAAKTAFLANMSHEIRTPLGAILGFVELMKRPKATKQNIGTYISVIERNSGHLLRIIDDILDLSKVEAGQMLVEQIDFSLPSMLADFTSFIGMRARERAVTFNLRATTQIPEVVSSDPTRIRQILTNIVGNAVKFTDRGEVVVEVAYEAPYLRFRVIDTGVGIAPADQTKLFEAFSQGDVSMTRKYGGTGLGLVLTRRLCQLMSGDLTLVRSEPGVGSVFEATVRVVVRPGVPFVRGNEVSVEPESDQPALEELAGLHLLVVEDLPDNQTLLNILLTDAGATVDIVSDGEKGIAAALGHRYDAVLMDIQMPTVDGHTAARTLRSRGYKGPLIALTAHAMKEEREKAAASGFSGFLAKPVTREPLITALLASVAVVRKKPSVLIVDDDADLREVLSSWLEGSHTTIAVASAEDALVAIAAATEPLIIMCDLSLPGMSGAELAQLIADRPDRQRFRIIAASGWDDIEVRAKRFGADGFVRKPFDLEKVAALLSRFTAELSR